MKNPINQINHKNDLGLLAVKFISPIIIVFSANLAVASEPGGLSFIAFFAGLIFAPLIQLFIYPILVYTDDAKPWTIVTVGIVSLIWAAYVSFSFVDLFAAIYFSFTMLIFLVSYFKKPSRIEKLKAQALCNQSELPRQRSDREQA